jgi:hypothetical protein
MIKVIKEKENQTEVKPFPKLMINSNNEIVYFIRKNYGLPINGNFWNYSGLMANIWAMADFTDYNEPVTIQNA